MFTGVITLLVVVSFSIWGRGAWKMACTLLGLTCGAIVGWITGILDPATLQHAPWLAVPHPVLFDLSFDAALAPAFLASGLAAGLRAIGVVTTCQRLNNAAWQRPNTANIKAGVLADGLSNLIGGPIGATGMSIGPSVVGISAAIGVTSRIIAFVTAGDEVSALLTFLRSNGASGVAGHLLAMNDGARFRLRLIYAASANSVSLSVASQPLATRTVAASAPLDLDNEEQAAFAGLAEFLRHLAADRKQVVTKDGQVTVRLAYGI